MAEDQLKTEALNRLPELRRAAMQLPEMTTVEVVSPRYSIERIADKDAVVDSSDA